MIDVCHTHPAPSPSSHISSPLLSLFSLHCLVLRIDINVNRFHLLPRIASSSASSHLDLEFLCAPFSFEGHAACGLGQLNHCYLDPLVALPLLPLLVLLLLVFRIAIMLTIRQITAMPPLWGLIIRRSLLKNFSAD